MVSIKKTALAVITLGVSSVASAGMYTPAPAPVPACTGINVTVPCERTGWDLGIQALYVQTNSIDDVAFTETSSSNELGDVFFNDVENFNPDWTWGFRLEGSYHFNTGSDINLNWTHLDQDNDNDNDNNNDNDDAGSSFVVGDQNVHGRFVDDPEELDGWDAIGTEVENKFDVVNLEYGQTVMFGEHATARFHGGLEWARIERDITQTGVAAEDEDDSIEGFLGVATSDSKFNGIGPRLGVDWNYNFGNGFSLVANAAASLLVGEIDLNATQFYTEIEDGAFDETTNASANPEDERVIVPGAEAKIGLAYTHGMQQGDLTIEGGFQVNHYWDAVDEASIDADGDLFVQNDADFSFEGVYFGVKWVANA